MIKPERMSRMAIVGPRKKLDKTIRGLYELNLFHLVDFVEEDPDVKIGAPLEQASIISQRLLKLRSIIRSLRLDEIRPADPVSVDEIERTSDEVIDRLERDVNEHIELRQNLVSKIRELTAQNEVLGCFREMGIPLEAYAPYDALSIFTGEIQFSISDKLNDLRTSLDFTEIQRDAGYFVSVFCRKEDAALVEPILNAAGFQELKSPFVTGNASDHISENRREIEELDTRLTVEEETIDSLRQKYAALVLAAEEHYSIEIKKAETPLRIATTPHSFVIEGWVPLSSYDAVKETVRKEIGDDVTVEDLAVSTEEEEERAPVKLKNPRVVRPFEFFVELMSTPLYNEVDPTLFVFIVFPLFFGVMIGDLGYGACLTLAGFIMYWKWGRESDTLRKLGFIIIAGGLSASFFGAIIFGDAFGLPFHPPAEHLNEPSWEFLFDYPMHPIMEKLIDVKEFLVLSVIAAWIHMGLGLIVGFFNERKHDMRHAMMKIFWLLILHGMFVQMLFIARWTVVGGFMFDILASPFAAYVMPFAGMSLSFFAIGLIVAGVIGFFVLHGKSALMELMEILSLLANIVSYTRLAAIGVAKGAMALAFNSIVIDNFFSGGEILFIVIGAVVLVVLQLLVFALGSLSSGIQALRLNYVEFFLKFFKGGGNSFDPLGYKRRFSKASEV